MKSEYLELTMTVSGDLEIKCINSSIVIPIAKYRAEEISLFELWEELITSKANSSVFSLVREKDLSVLGGIASAILITDFIKIDPDTDKVITMGNVFYYPSTEADPLDMLLDWEVLLFENVG